MDTFIAPHLLVQLQQLAHEHQQTVNECLAQWLSNITRPVTPPPRGVWLCHYTPQGELLWVTEGLAEVWQTGAGRSVGQVVWSYFAPEQAEIIKMVVGRAIYRPYPTLHEWRLREGERWVQWIQQPVFTPAGEVAYIQATAEEISERKRSEIAQKQSVNTLLTLAEHAPGVIYLCRNNDNFSMIYLNEAIERLTGYTRRDFLDQHITFRELYHPDDSSLITPEDESGRGIFSLVYRIKHRSGQWKWVEDVGGGVYDETGKLQYLAGFMTDVTERLHTEEVLRQRQKAESLGLLAGGIAHDFNNLLVAMIGQASLALSRLEPQHPAFAHLQKGVKAAEKAAELTQQLLAYSGRGQFKVSLVSLNEIVQENITLFELLIRQQAQIKLTLASELPLIEADSHQIQQVMMNLVLNGAEAMGERPGVIELKTEVVRLFSSLELSNTVVLAAGWYVVLQVQDNGQGMDENTLERIFDPFFTTKFTGRGLGLAAVQGIVRGHKGGLQVKSEVGRGTVFRLYLPVAQPISPPAGGEGLLY